jgi:hypothetical protein
MGYDSKVKERIEVKTKVINGRLYNLKQFIEFLNNDRDIVMDRSVVQLIKKTSKADELNIIVEKDLEKRR